jgi:very-short-patch-repair endonuclease
VLISRAKLRCEVFSSITDDDIDLERARGKGVVAFKLFLRFARTGRMDLAGADAAGVADVFESQVAAALRTRGYDVHPRVGIAGLFIDLAVADPAYPGRYLLGVECDGRSYSAARSARDRDRLRRAVLEDHGWAMHRIWSFDWLHRPQEELNRLVAAIEAAKAELADSASQASRRKKAVHVEIAVIDRGDVVEIGLEPAADDSSGAPAYRMARVHALRNYPEIPAVPPALLGGLVEAIVGQEGPVHLDVVVTRIRDAWGAGRAGNKIRGAIEDAAAMVVRARRIRNDAGFLSVPGVAVVPRDRSKASDETRKPDMVAPGEIQEAVLTVVRQNLGVKHSEIASAVTRMLGFSATTQTWKDLIATQVAAALKQRRLHLRDDMLVLATNM